MRRFLMGEVPLYMGTSLIRMCPPPPSDYHRALGIILYGPRYLAHKTMPPPLDYHGALGIGLLQGPSGRFLLVSEEPFSRP